MERKSIVSFFVILVIGAFLRLFNLMYFHSLDTDEAIYAQIVFAMTRGYTLYKDIGFVHPPLYPYIEYPFVLVSPNLWTIRLVNVLLGMATICLIFYLSKLLYSEKIALIASATYALYPWAIYSNKIALIDNGLTFFTILMIYLFAKYLKEGDVKYLLLSGLFAGISFMTKYTAILFIAALVLYATVRIFKRRIKHLLLFIAGAMVFPLAILVVLLSTGVWPYFFMQSIHWHLIRFGMPLPEKLWFLGQIFGSLLPLLLIAMPTLHNNIGEWRDELIMSWFFIPLAILSLSKIVFTQYGFSLMPPISILVARSVNRYTKSKFSLRTLNLKNVWKGSIVLLTIFILLAYLETSINLSYGMRWLFFESIVGEEQQGMLLQAQIDTGNYIYDLTNPGDKIWTTEASIAFFAQRLIVAPHSEYWRFQGFFQDVWGYGWTPDDYRGPISGYPNGLFTLHDIQLAWENEKPKVMVIVNSSWVDYFIWHGINNTYHMEEGLADYVQSHYQLAKTFQSQNIAVWIRKDI